MEINILPFVIEALGNNKKVYKDIDKLYQTYKYEFYKAAKEHELYNHQIVTEGSLVQEEYCKKVLGIIAGAGEKEDVYIELDKIIKKGFSWTYTYVEKHPKIEVAKYLKAFLKKHNGPIDADGNVIDRHFIILILLSVNNNIELIQDDIYNKFMGDIKFRWDHYQDEESTRISIDKSSDECKKKMQELKIAIFKKYGAFRNFDEMLSREFEKKELEQCAFLFDYENLSSISIFEDIKFTEKDLDEILYLYVLNTKETDVTEATKYLISYMYIRYLIKAYKKVKEMYFENNKETMFLELEGLEKSLHSTEQKLFSAKQDLSELQNKYELLEKENFRLKKELEQERKNREELNSLREFLFSLDKEEGFIEEKINPEELKNYKAVVIGGHEKWQQRMKELLPNFIFIHPDNLNFDIRLLDGIEIVFVYVNYLSHGIYYKVMSAIEGTNIKVAYLNRQNEDKVLQKIYKEIYKIY